MNAALVNSFSNVDLLNNKGLKMIYKNIEFHNVIELYRRDEFSGLQLQRTPVKIQKHLSERGRWNSQMLPNSEIRFITDAENIRLFISTLQGDASLLVYNGDILNSEHYLTPGKTHCIHVKPNEKFKTLDRKAFNGSRFSPNVWRFYSSGLFLMFHQLETFGHSVRPPEIEEKPKMRWLAYGSSITMGTGASRPDLSYVNQTARRLGVDVFNMGQGGACMCEPELADFFAERHDWDFATLEIGVNMLTKYSLEEFSKRATYMFETLVKKHPDKPIIVITPFLNFHHMSLEETLAKKRQAEYTQFLNKMVLSSKSLNAHVIDGRDILTDFTGLCADLIHPHDIGTISMSENLCNKLKPIILGI